MFSIDTTYDAGDFYVTSAAYSHINLHNHSTGPPLYLPWPAMLHVKLEESQFKYLGHTLIGKKPGIDGVFFHWS